MKDIIVFSNEWFEYHQNKLLKFANSKFGRYTLRIHGDRSDIGKNKITKIEPHAISWSENGQQKTEFRSHAKFSKRLYYAFRPIWHLIHLWDMQVANRLNYALNLGFDTLTVYPDTDASTTMDGYTERESVNQTFANIRSGAGNFATTNELTLLIWLSASSTSNQYDALSRAFALFNTSSIGSSNTVVSATLQLYGSAKYNTLGSTDLVAVASSPTSNTSLSSSDHSNISSTSFGTISYTNFSTSAYNSIELNASGIANVSTTNISKFGLRLEWDRANSFTGVWSSSGSSSYFAHSADRSGTSKDPKLVVVYAVIPSAYYSSSNPYASGKMRYKNSGGSWTDRATSDLYFTTYTSDGATTVTYSSQDPSDILTAVIDNYGDYGGEITYSSTIDTTSTVVSYTFNTNTILECINKVLELSPQNWYWYIDPATNYIHLQEKSTTADHKFTLGKDIESMEVEKRSENIINTVYFTGGGDPPLYKKYQDADSVGIYGIRATRYTDERVTSASTAQVISTSILNRQASPELRVRLTIIDSNYSTNGYDIESINVGDVINIQNTGDETNSSLWDVFIWDYSKWDYDLTSIGTMYLQIMRVEYSPDKAYLICSTIPPDISKRIEDINRNLENSLSSNNPSAPA